MAVRDCVTNLREDPAKDQGQRSGPVSGYVLHLCAQCVQHRLPACITTDLCNPAGRINTIDKCDGQGGARQKRAKALRPFDQTDGIDKRILDAEFQRLCLLYTSDAADE